MEIAAEIIGELTALGLKVSVQNQKLLISGDRTNLSKGLLARITAEKENIIACLTPLYSDLEIIEQPIFTAKGTQYTTTGAQRRLWLLSQFDKAGAAYNITVRLNLRGRLDVMALQQSIDLLTARHESLRTIFRFEEGKLEQLVMPAHKVPLTVNDISSLSDLDKEEFIVKSYKDTKNRLFDLASGPLIEIGIIALNTIDSILFITVHHIVSDGWSLKVLTKEILDNYKNICKGISAKMPELLQYGNYAAWLERKTWTLKVLHASFWKLYIPEEPVFLELPTVHRRPAFKSFDGNKARKYIKKPTYDGISALSASAGVTVFNFFRATFALLLAKLTGQKSIPIGIPVSCRTSRVLINEIGLYINTLPFFSRYDPNAAFKQFLQETSLDSWRVLAHQDYPFDMIVSDLGLTGNGHRNPLFDVMMVFNEQVSKNDLSVVSQECGLEITSAEERLYHGKDHEYLDVGAQMDLTFIFGNEPGGEHYLDVEYNSTLFDSKTIQNFIGYYEFIIGQVLAEPDIILSEIRLLSNEQVEVYLKDFNDTAHQFEHSLTVTELFEKVVKEIPGAVAVKHEGAEITYSALNEKANRLVGYIRSRYTIMADTPVAIKLEKSLWMLISILAVLKSGGAYVPINPRHPPQRTDFILNNSSCAAVIDQSLIDDFKALEQNYSGEDTRPLHHPGNLAYIIYTSGSTGQPKGCMLEHRSLVNRLQWMWTDLKFDRSDVILQKTAFSFDVSIWELLMPLCYGAQMVLCNATELLSPKHLKEVVANYSVTCMHFVPTMLNTFLEFDDRLLDTGNLLKSLKKVIASGEALTGEVVNKWYSTSSVPLYNLYGPTEAAIDVTCYKVLPTDVTVPIGKPIWNTQLYIFNEDLQLLPPGIIGEICIGGVGLARGYINQPDLSAEKFCSNPLQPKERIYRTGDLGRWREDGNIEFLGRQDDQVKIRGHRVELGEIENILMTHPDIREAAVVTKKGPRSIDEISAFIVCCRPFFVTELNGFLSSILPDFMLPASYIQLDVLPLNASGKTDKKALKNNGKTGLTALSVYTEAASDLEKQLSEVWRQVLEREKVGVNDNFFDLGGNSLKVLSLVAAIKRHIGTDIPVVKIFQFPTISLLAAELTSTDPENRNTEAEADVLRTASVGVMEQTLSLLNFKI